MTELMICKLTSEDKAVEAFDIISGIEEIATGTQLPVEAVADCFVTFAQSCRNCRVESRDMPAATSAAIKYILKIADEIHTEDDLLDNLYGCVDVIENGGKPLTESEKDEYKLRVQRALGRLSIYAYPLIIAPERDLVYVIWDDCGKEHTKFKLAELEETVEVIVRK